MARGSTRTEAAARRELPPPLPPETRTVGQVVAETIRVYQRRPRRALATGVLPGLVGVAAAELSRWWALGFSIVVGAPVFTLSYLLACGLVVGVSVRSPAGRRAFVSGVLVFLPFPLLASLFLLPGLVWFGFFGLAVPAVLVEGRSVRDGFRRARQLGTADFGHVLGGLVTLGVLVVLSQGVVFFLLRGFAEAAARTSALLAGIVLTPVLFLGTAVLYGDQVARVGSRGRRSRRRDADLPDVDHAHGEGRADAQVESGPSA
jgi:hypothetical protein